MDQLFFYSKSANKPAGKGTNELVSEYSKYRELNEVKDWRKVLSNFYVSQFVYDGKTYNSVEHAFQGKKIQLVDEDKANWFTVDSKHPIGLGDGNDARKNRKLVMLSEKTLKEWNDIKHNIMKDILMAKFSQVPLAKKVLLLTKDAKLLHGTRGIPITRQMELEYVRSQLET